MILTKNEINKIIKKYNLGKLISFNLIKEGIINYNHNLITNKGEYIIQVFGGKYNQWMKKHMHDIFKVLNYLKIKNFPYQTPQPLKNKNYNFISRVGKNYLWVYEKIKGSINKEFNISKFREAAKALAIYHNYIEKLKGKKSKISSIEKLKKEYIEIRDLPPKDKTTKLLKENINTYFSLIRKIEKVNFAGTCLFRHEDFNTGNLIFSGNKLSGIIDFGNSHYGPITKDIAIAIKRINYQKDIENKIKIFLDQYKKWRKLNKKEEKLILAAIIRSHIGETMWLCRRMKKAQDKKYKFMKFTIEMAKKLDKIN